ncbi:MAG: hypothetical protein R3B89_14375 [Polyangiaceae bacterium]
MSVSRVGAERPRHSSSDPGDQPRPETRIRTESARSTRAVQHLVHRSGSPAARAARRSPNAEAIAALRRPSAGVVLRRLDAFRESFAGPYRIDGESARVDPQFRMNGGYGTNPDEALERASAALPPAVLARLRTAIRLTATGKAEPRMLVTVTQALIDAGAHHEFGEGASAVRKMMWKYGIGVDCSGYCRRAFLASRGVSEASGRARYGIGRSVDGFDPDQLRAFRRVKPLGVRAGDMGKLGTGRDTHKVIVASHDVFPTTQRSVDVPGHGTLPAAFRGQGRVHVYQVDSSWGAGPHGNPHGGVGRRVWVYSESSGLWGSYDSGSGKLETSPKGPYGYELNGFFRPRSED